MQTCNLLLIHLQFFFVGNEPSRHHIMNMNRDLQNRGNGCIEISGNRRLRVESLILFIIK